MQPGSAGVEWRDLPRPIDVYWIPHVLRIQEAVNNEMVKVLPRVSMTIEDDHVRFIVTSDKSWHIDRTSVDTTIDGFGWTPWFKLSPSVHNLCIERPVESVFDLIGPSLPDATNDQGLGVMHTSIHPMSCMTGNCVPRTIDSS